MATRKERRIESKKRKAAAFLQLINGKDSEEPNSSAGENKKMKLEDANTETTEKKKSMSDEMYAEYKKKLAERHKAAMQVPKVFLTLDELTRDHPHYVDENGVKMVPPLFMSDVQHLLMFSVLNVHSSFRPRWCRLLRVCKVTKTVAIVLDSLSATEFNTYKESLPTLHQAFDLNVDITAPCQYGSSVREDIMNVPIRVDQVSKPQPKGKVDNKKLKVVKVPTPVIKRQKWLQYKQTRNLHSNPLHLVEMSDKQVKALLKTDGGTEGCDGDDSSPTEPVDGEVEGEATEETFVSTHKQDKFDRRWLMLNSAQILLENIPTPSDVQNKSFKGFVFSKQKYKQVSSRSPMFAVDCEMVQTKASKMDLARVSIVDENLEVVYDSFVKPRAQVTDYVTQFSGITKELLDPVTTTLEDVQKVIQTHLPPDAILCGQSIGNDLNSMKMFHPYLIDTSVIYNLTGTRQKTGLKQLTSIFLSRSIQDSPRGHSSVEDAMATMELVLLKLRNRMDFGDTNVTEQVLKAIDPAKEQEEPEELSDTDAADSTVTKTILPDNISPELRRKRLFFRHYGRQFIESFIQRIGKHGKKGSIIDEADSVSLYPSNHPVVTADTDKHSEQQTLSCMSDGDFTLTHMYGYRNFLRDTQGKAVDEEELKKCLWKLDRRFWKIMIGLPECSLFVVTLTGRTENGVVHSAKVFAKIL